MTCESPPARTGSARFGTARLESARFGSARLGSARRSSARPGSARLSSARLGSARTRLGSAWPGPARPGWARLSSARLGLARLARQRLSSARARLGPAVPTNFLPKVRARLNNRTFFDDFLNVNWDFVVYFGTYLGRSKTPSMLRGRSLQDPPIYIYIFVCCPQIAMMVVSPPNCHNKL